MKIHENDTARKNALLPLAKILNNVSVACRILGFSRDTYYRASKSLDNGEALKADVRKSRTQSTKIVENRKKIEQMILNVASNNPFLGKRAIAKIISESGSYISASKVYSVIKNSETSNPDKEKCPIEKKPLRNFT